MSQRVEMVVQTLELGESYASLTFEQGPQNILILSCVYCIMCDTIIELSCDQKKAKKKSLKYCFDIYHIYRQDFFSKILIGLIFHEFSVRTAVTLCVIA